MVAHQSTRFLVHLAPLGARLDDDAQAGEVDGDDIVGFLRLLRRHFAIGRDDAEIVLVDDDEAIAVARRDEPVDGVNEFLGAPRRQVEALESRARSILVEALEVVTQRAGERGEEPREATGDRPQRGVAGCRYGERNDSLVESVDVDVDVGGAQLGGAGILRWSRRTSGDVRIER